jgi:hypothetical protein
MDKIKFYQRLAAEKSTETLMIKLPAVLKEFVATKPNMSQYAINLIIADYERQDTAPADEGQIKALEKEKAELIKKLLIVQNRL